MSTNQFIFLEMALISVAVLGFAVRELWKLTPKQIAKEDAKARARAERYAREEASEAAARHSKR